MSIPRRYGSNVDLTKLDVDVDEMARDYADDVVQIAVSDAEKHLATVAKRLGSKDPETTPQDALRAFRDDTAWVNAAARTTTTTTSAETALDMLPLVEDETGERHELLWVSRGDPKVRRSHRQLHGRVRKMGKSFKHFATGQQLRFPGDPEAPLDEIINCRCGLLLVPAAQARSAMDVFQVDEAQWDDIDRLAASIGRAQDMNDQAWVDLIAERSQ